MANLHVCKTLSSCTSYAKECCTKAIALSGRTIQFLAANRETIFKLSAVAAVIAVASGACFAASLAAGFGLIALAHQFPTAAKVIGLVTAGITAIATTITIIFVSILSMMPLRY